MRAWLRLVADFFVAEEQVLEAFDAVAGLEEAEDQVVFLGLAEEVGGEAADGLEGVFAEAHGAGGKDDGEGGGILRAVGKEDPAAEHGGFGVGVEIGQGAGGRYRRGGSCRRRGGDVRAAGGVDAGVAGDAAFVGGAADQADGGEGGGDGVGGAVGGCVVHHTDLPVGRGQGRGVVEDGQGAQEVVAAIPGEDDVAESHGAGHSATGNGRSVKGQGAFAG